MRRFLSRFFATIGLLVTLCIIAGIALLYTSQSKRMTLPRGAVLHLNLGGEMPEVNTSDVLERLIGRSAVSLKDVVDSIDAASKDDRIHAIVARVDTAAMGVAQAQEIRDAISRFRKEGRNKGKVAIAYAETFGEMGPGTLSYYLASSFDEIWIQPLGSVGLMGLYVEIPFVKKALDDWHIKPQFGKREQYKSAIDTYTESKFSEANKEATTALMNTIMNQIVRDIASERELTEVEVRQAVDQGPLRGIDAKKMGLIDQVGYMDELERNLAERIGVDPEFVEPGRYLSTLPPTAQDLPKIALIGGSGAIQREMQTDVFGNMIMSSEVLKEAFEEALEDSEVKAIVFRINSGGGSAVASETISRATVLAQEAGKPVIVSMSNAAASGGYWIAASADKIVAHPGTITGSIGVYSGKVSTEAFWDKFGIHWGAVQIGKNADMWSPIKEFTPHGWQRLQAFLDDIYATFIDKVAKGRSLSVDHVRAIAKGRVWTGEDALRLGLVDALGGMRRAVELAKASVGLQDEEVAIEVYPKPKSFTRRIKESLYGKGEIKATILSSVLQGLLKTSFKETYEKMKPLTHSEGPLSTPHPYQPQG